MNRIVDNPFLVFGVSLVILWSAACVGDLVRKTVRPVQSQERPDFDTVLTATLTLLALIIGFSFSMAVSRYDQRKTCEEAEANAIGTEYLRGSLLPEDSAAKTRDLLKKYLDERIAFYRSATPPPGAGAGSGATEAALWSTVAAIGKTQPTPVTALAIAGMNDVLNTQGYTQAAWWNRIPGGAWALLAFIAIFSNLLLGYRERRTVFVVLLVLPVVASIAFFLIADIDSPTGGIIRVAPYNLIAVAQSLNAP